MNTLRKQFSDALKREGKIITTYYKSEMVKCLFRKNNDKNNTDNHLTIFYDVSAPISQGKLLSYNGKQYIVLNKETIENNIYYKSDLKECNTRIIVGVGNIGHLVPCYSSDLISPLPSEGKVITTIDGNIELITEDTEVSRHIEINNRYILMGGTYQVINKLIKSGIYYFYMQRITNSEPVYTLDVTSEFATYDEGEEVPLTVLPMADGITDPTATITYSSSDISIATVNNTGLVNCIAKGSVTITVTWVEKNLTDTITLTVKSNAPLIYIVTVTGDNGNEQYLGIEHTFTTSIKDSLGNPITTYNLVYSTANVDSALTGYITLTDNHNGTATVIVGDFDDVQLVMKKFDLVCTDTLSGFSGSLTLTVVNLY